MLMTLILQINNANYVMKQSIIVFNALIQPNVYYAQQVCFWNQIAAAVW